ncbi:MAG: ATP-dependent DNA helicase RecG, partial [Flavobacteriales bacterium]|nr:ATP-dependent DNA helicase RecG [Flavobacteriales bacterium]
MLQNPLQTPIEYLNGVGPQRGDLLKKELKLFTYGDLLHLFPRRYIDKTQYYKINEINANSSEVQVVGKLVSLQDVKQKRGSRLVGTFVDETGQMDLVWFRATKWLKQNLKVNKVYVVFGKPTKFGHNMNIAHPEMELLDEHKRNMRSAMQAVYPSTEKLSKLNFTSRTMSRIIQDLFHKIGGKFAETLSPEIIDRLSLISKNDALFNIHFPINQELLSKAQFRLKFEELFYIQIELISKKLIRKNKLKSYVFTNVGKNFNDFYNKHLPFELTGAQKRVLKEIRQDTLHGEHMNRLVQGDVGSGKTIVAFMCMLIAIDNGFQATMMAPTEILATQHYEGVSELVEQMDLRVELLTGSTKTAKRREIHEALLSGEIDILIGTHALIEDKVVYKNLGIAVIDEQHRFGVAQRAKLWKKNAFAPHVLVMTATPIPRTLAMSLYGDLDISVIDELPPGRKPIKTIHRYDSNRLRVFKFMKDEVAKGRQIYLVYPLIEESENMDYKDLMDGYESVKRYFPMPEYQLSMVHGKMKSADKEFEMNRFVEGKTQIMVATTVIEVGVNVPNASVMIIESAERFGLSQLHQLRGRVGRGAEQSYCILMTGVKLSNDSKTRLETMVRTNDGF